MARFSKRKQKANRQQYYSANRDKVSTEMKCYYERTADVRKEAYASNPEPKRQAVKSRYASNPEPKRQAVKSTYASNPEPKRQAVKSRYASNPEPKKKTMKTWYASKDESHKSSMKSRYTSNPELKRMAMKSRYTSNPEPKRMAMKSTYTSSPEPKRMAMKSRYTSNPEPKRMAMKSRYTSNPVPKRMAMKSRYTSNPEPKRMAMKSRYTSNPEPKRMAMKSRYTSNPEPKRMAMKSRYTSNPEPKRMAMKSRYSSNPEAKKFIVKTRYNSNRSAVLLRQRSQYYASRMCRRAARLLHHALHRSRENAKNKLYREKNKQSILIARKARYALNEPKMDTREVYVKSMKKRITSKPTLKRELLRAFRNCCNPLAEKIKRTKLTNAVLNISTRKLLNRVLKARRQSVGELLRCIRSVNALQMSCDDFGESRHTASSEPFFYDQSYTIVKHTLAIVVDDNDQSYAIVEHKSVIVVDDNGRCVIAEEEGERDAKTNRPKRWKCTSECKLPTETEAQCIMATKALFKNPIQTLREGLNGIDQCSEHGHYKHPLNADHEMPYYELAGHPLPCTMVNADCKSSLRVLRAAATHFPLLRRLVGLLYEAIRQHRLLESIDTALCAGDFEKLTELCRITEYNVLMKACSIDENCSAAGLVDSEDQPIRLQKPKLPDLESELHINHAELIAELEKKFADDAEFPCCSCERLFQRKQVTAFKFSEAKFSSDIWKTLKARISNNNSGAAVQTHYVCQYCRPLLNKNKMPGRCVLNGLEVEPVPQDLQKLDPLSKQLIQRAKAFQAVIRLGTYTGKVPSYNSLKACKGTMFFLPLPLEKTVQTLEAVENKVVGASARLPDPEVYMIVNTKPSQKRKFIWQSLINVDKLKGALRTLKNINWLYADLDENSLDDASRRVIESVSNTSSTMLEKVSVEDISSYQAYTIRRLDQCQSSHPDCEQYKLTDVKETAMSNKFKYLDVLCFPTLFPSGRFGESHPRQVPISPSEFAKSHILNKDSRFRKDSQYIFYLLWQKEMRELAAGVYNLLKGTRQHALPVGELMARVSNSDQDVEANLSTVFQSVRGSKQYWYLRRSDVLCMVREYGSPTLFLTLSCAEYESHEISNYLRKVNSVSDSYPIGKLCTEDPVSVSRKFSKKFHDFFDTVILNGSVLGPVAHYFYKKEYQARGAPHYHIILWIEGAPTAGEDDSEEVLRWIQNRITCRIPEEESNPELHHLVTKYQYHKCSNYCRRRKRVKGTYITYCRFGFPRPTCESATLLSIDECMKSSHRKVYKLPRSPKEIRVNNYNPLLLMLWKANMDIQFIGESTLAIAQYVTGYVTKAEKSNLQDLWQEVSSHQSIYSKLWSFGVRSLRSRECGLYEASDLLLGDHLCGKSKTIKWVDVSQPHNRKRRLINHSRLVEMNKQNPNSTAIFEDNLIDTFYPQRPKHMEEVCLYDFVADYVKCGVDKDGNIVYRKLNKSVLPNHRVYNPNKENEKENYFYSLLLLFVPFRNEDDLIEEGESADEAFDRHMEQNDALNIHSEKLQRMLKANENVQKINEARQAEQENVTVPEPVEEDEGPQVAGEATSAMHDVVDLQQNDQSGPSFDDLVSLLNVDQRRIFQHVKDHLEHQVHHESDTCKCSDWKPLHMFISGVGGTGKSFMIKTIRALVSEIWHDKTESLLCAVTAPTGLAAFNVGGVTIHRLLQLPIEHEGRAAGYWRLGKDSLKVMRRSLSQLRLLIIDEVSMLSNLNLAYVHLRLDEIFGRDQWFGGVNVLFVGDILQLPPVNGAPVFDRINNKSVASKLGCMTSVNIWQDTVLYDELTINERQKKDQAFSSMLDEVRRGCPSPECIRALQERVIETPVVDKFEELLVSKLSPLCLFPTRKSCQEFNSRMLSRLEAEVKEIPCIDEVDETSGTFKWSKKATEEMKKLNRDCNLTAGLEAVLQIAVGARVMLRRNIDTGIGLVNGAVGTVVTIKAHHIGVQFDNIPKLCHVERVKSRFMVLKKMYVHRKQFPLILAFAVTIHKCQGLSLDCAMMELSDQVFCAGMAYVALSRVKQLDNLHLIAFQPQSVMVSTRCLEEINRLRLSYRPDLPQYTIPSGGGLTKRKRTLSGTVLSNSPNPKHMKIVSEGTRRKTKSQNKLPTVHLDPPNPKTVSVGTQSKSQNILPTMLSDTPNPKRMKNVSVGKLPTENTSDVREGLILDRYRYNPVSVEWQRRVCLELGLRFVCANKSVAGGPDVTLKPPTLVKTIPGDGNCLFRALSYVITGSQRQHFQMRRLIVEHLRTEENCIHLIPNYITDDTIEEYIQRTLMDRAGRWGSTAEMLVLAHMVGANVASFNTHDEHYHVLSPGVIDCEEYPQDDSRPTIYVAYTHGNHFNVVLSQD